MLVQVVSFLICLFSCEFSGESDYLITVDCSDLVSDFKSRLETGEQPDLLLVDLEYGVMAELEDFARKLLIFLTETYKETNMVEAKENGLSANSQLTNLYR